jgi:hypothetical protein
VSVIGHETPGEEIHLELLSPQEQRRLDRIGSFELLQRSSFTRMHANRHEPGCPSIYVGVERESVSRHVVSGELVGTAFHP